MADIHFKQMAATRSPCRCFKIRVLHFKVKNTQLKDKKWKEKVQKNVQHGLFCSAWSVLKCNQGSDVLAEFSGTFCQDNYVFEKGIYVFLNVS